MDRRALERYAKRLADRRAELLQAGPAQIEPNRTDAATTGVADDDAQALYEMLQTLASTRNRESAQLIRRIDQALRKVRDAPDDFGACEDCGEAIDARRLDVLPWAALCTECQGKADPKRNVGRRKLTDFS